MRNRYLNTEKKRVLVETDLVTYKTTEEMKDFLEELDERLNLLNKEAFKQKYQNDVYTLKTSLSSFIIHEELYHNILVQITREWDEVLTD